MQHHLHTRRYRTSPQADHGRKHHRTVGEHPAVVEESSKKRCRSLVASRPVRWACVPCEACPHRTTLSQLPRRALGRPARLVDPSPLAALAATGPALARRGDRRCSDGRHHLDPDARRRRRRGERRVRAVRRRRLDRVDGLVVRPRRAPEVARAVLRRTRPHVPRPPLGRSARDGGDVPPHPGRTRDRRGGSPVPRARPRTRRRGWPAPARRCSTCSSS